jgi:alkylated DNA repair protein alkB family protein 1
MRRAELETDPCIFDLGKYSDFSKEQKELWRPSGCIPASQIAAACQAYAGDKQLVESPNDAPIFEHRHFPGLQVISRLLPPEAQMLFTSCLMHRDVANPGHKINLQADYDIPYPPEPTLEPLRFDHSFFDHDRSSAEVFLTPKVPGQTTQQGTISVHKASMANPRRAIRLADAQLLQTCDTVP